MSFDDSKVMGCARCGSIDHDVSRCRWPVAELAEERKVPSMQKLRGGAVSRWPQVESVVRQFEPLGPKLADIVKHTGIERKLVTALVSSYKRDGYLIAGGVMGHQRYYLSQAKADAAESLRAEADKDAKPWRAWDRRQMNKAEDILAEIRKAGDAGMRNRELCVRFTITVKTLMQHCRTLESEGRVIAASSYADLRWFAAGHQAGVDAYLASLKDRAKRAQQRKNELPKKVSRERIEQAHEVVRSGGADGVSRADVQRLLGVAERTAQKLLLLLRKDGLAFAGTAGSEVRYYADASHVPGHVVSYKRAKPDVEAILRGVADSGDEGVSRIEVERIHSLSESTAQKIMTRLRSDGRIFLGAHGAMNARYFGSEAQASAYVERCKSVSAELLAGRRERRQEWKRDVYAQRVKSERVKLTDEQKAERANQRKAERKARAGITAIPGALQVVRKAEKKLDPVKEFIAKPAENLHEVTPIVVPGYRGRLHVDDEPVIGGFASMRPGQYLDMPSRFTYLNGSGK